MTFLESQDTRVCVCDCACQVILQRCRSSAGGPFAPVRKNDPEEEEETSDCAMEEINGGQPLRSNLHDQDYSHIEQADYDRESETEEEKNPPSRPHEERPPHKAMPTQPPVPPLRLSSKAKAQPQNPLDEETESDNQQRTNANRPPLPRRPTMMSPPLSIDHSRWITDKNTKIGIQLLKESFHPQPFWNSRVPFGGRVIPCPKLHPDFERIPSN